MNIILTFIIFGLCLTAMAIGLIISKKVLTKGCDVDPDNCACRNEGKDPSDCSS